MTATIKCPFCSEEIDLSCNICPYCAEKLSKSDNQIAIIEKSEETASEEDPKTVKQITTNKRIANQFKNHLEFFGFVTEDIESEKGNTRVMITGRHDKRSNVIVNILAEDSILISSRYVIEAVKTSEKLSQTYEHINKANLQALLTRWSYTQDTDDSIVVIEMFMRSYEKIDFGKNLELMESEIRSYLQLFTDSNS